MLQRQERSCTCSGSETTLKVSVGTCAFLSCPSTFFGSTSTISRFGERFRDDQYSLVSFLFAVLLLTARPRAQPIVKVRGPPSCPMESALLSTCYLTVATILLPLDS